MSLVRLAVARPVSTLMACLMVALLGWVALGRLAIDLMPSMTYPTVSVTTIYLGAGPEEIETLVTRPLEQALSSVTGVDRLASSSAEGSSTIRVRLQWGYDIDAAINDMRQAIAKVRRFLPADAEEPYISRFDVADRPIMYLGLTSDLSTIELTHLAEKQVVPRLERIDGVARVSVRGGLRREIQVDLRRSELLARNLSVTEVVDAIGRESVNQPAGDYDEGVLRRLVRTHGEFRNLDEVANTVVRQRAGAVVRVRDVAQVVDGQEDQTEITRTNAHDGLMLYIFRQAGANTVEVSDRVHREVARHNEQSSGLQLTVRIDQADFIRQSIANVKQSAVYGMVLAVVVLVLFLRSFRSTIVIAVSMPLSVLATFIMIYFKGFTLNMVSFGGLALGIGLLVDNSIVVLESIFRKRDAGIEPRTAAIEGTSEVAVAIVASTVTTLIVFLPLMFVDGLTGIMLHQLAWVVSMSLVASLVASLTLTPMLTTVLNEGQMAALSQSVGSARPATAVTQRLHRVTGWLFDTVECGYAHVLRGVLRNSGWVGAALLLLFAVTVGLTPRIGTEFLPKTDEGDLRVSGEMAPGIQLEQLKRQVLRIEQVVMNHVPEAPVVSVIIGNRPESGDEWHTCSFRMRLVSRDRRDRGVEEIRRDLEKQIGSIPGMSLRVAVSNDSMFMGSLSRVRGNSSSGDIEVEITGHDLRVAQALAVDVMNRMREIPGLINIEIQKQDERPELAAKIDREKANGLGVSVADIVNTLETTVRGRIANVYREEGDEYNVRVRLRRADRDTPADIEQVGVASPKGQLIPLKNLVEFVPDTGAVSINRLDQQRIIVITAGVENRDLGGAVADLSEQLDEVNLPRGFAMRIAGTWEEQQKSFTMLWQGLVLAVLLMFMVMAAQFESLRDPLIIMAAVPMGAMGVIVTLVATGTTLNVQSFIGVIMLAGIVVNNAIVLVDYIKQLRAAEPETDTLELVVRGAVRRLRPVLMTTLTTVLAMTPIALAWGDGGELQAPMARVVIGGLGVGTLVTLLAVPLIYLHFGSGARPTRAAAPTSPRRETNSQPEPAPLGAS